MSVASNAICIPKMEMSISKTFIRKVFQQLQIGEIDGIIEIALKDSPKHKRIIIKVRWNDSETSAVFLQRFQNGENVKLVYSPPSPWFWICVPNRLHCKTISDVHALTEAHTSTLPTHSGDTLN